MFLVKGLNITFNVAGRDPKMNDSILEKLKKAIVEGKIDDAGELTRSALNQGFAAKDILQNGLIPGIREIGELFGDGEAYLPELIVAGRAMEQTIEQLEPHFNKEDAISRGKFLIGTVKGDLHDIGKNIVTMMMKGNGWEVVDLGVDVPPETFCEAVKDGSYDVLGLSALLTTTMMNVISTIEALQEAGLRDKIKIIIGGAPVNQEFTDKVGADAWGEDGWDAVVKSEQLLDT